MRLIASLLFLTAVMPQDALHVPEFEVASVKPAAPQTGDGVFVGIRGGPGTQDPTSIRYVNESLRNLLSEAYDVRAFQVFGPVWMDTERYDIAAKVAEGSTRDQTHLMLQSLLADRFKVVLHHEAREFLVFELTVAKSGSKLKLSGADDRPSMMMMTKSGQSRLAVGKHTVADLARALEKEVGTQIIDKTGLTAYYTFTLEFVRDTGRVVNEFTGLPTGTPSTVDNSSEAPGLS